MQTSAFVKVDRLLFEPQFEDPKHPRTVIRRVSCLGLDPPFQALSRIEPPLLDAFAPKHRCSRNSRHAALRLTSCWRLLRAAAKLARLLTLFSFSSFYFPFHLDSRARQTSQLTRKIMMLALSCVARRPGLSANASPSAPRCNWNNLPIDRHVRGQHAREFRISDVGEFFVPFSECMTGSHSIGRA